MWSEIYYKNIFFVEKFMYTNNASVQPFSKKNTFMFKADLFVIPNVFVWGKVMFVY